MPRGDQVSRQWRILRMLEGSRAGMRVPDILAALEEPCTERTIFRDLVHLQEAGFPLWQDGGRWRVTVSEGKDYAAPLKPTELVALALAEDLLAPLDGTGLAQAFASLRSKVDSMLTPAGRRYVAELRTRFRGTVRAPAELGGHSLALESLQRGIEGLEVVRLRYAGRAKSEAVRLVDPYALWFADGRPYLVGYCHARRDFRIFLVPRMREVALTDEHFERDPTFDLRKYAEPGFGVWAGETHAVELLFARDVAHVARERRLHASQRVEPRDDGSALVRMEVAGLPVLAAWLAGFGGAVRVLAPATLRDMLRDIHRAGLKTSGLKPPVAARRADRRRSHQRRG